MNTSKQIFEKNRRITKSKLVDVRFDDTTTQYICSKCMQNLHDNPGDCEVSCDMD